jgi:TonB family protein
MIRAILLLIFVTIQTVVLCQNTPINDSLRLGTMLENSPIYKGGYSNLIRFIEENFLYPESAKIDSIEGVVYVSFKIETDGSTSEHKIVKGIREDLNAEALRLAKMITFEKSAYHGGVPVRIQFFLPITFKLP